MPAGLNSCTTNFSSLLRGASSLSESRGAADGEDRQPSEFEFDEKAGGSRGARSFRERRAGFETHRFRASPPSKARAGVSPCVTAAGGDERCRGSAPLRAGFPRAPAPRSFSCGAAVASSAVAPRRVRAVEDAGLGQTCVSKLVRAIRKCDLKKDCPGQDRSCRQKNLESKTKIEISRDRHFQFSDTKTAFATALAAT